MQIFGKARGSILELAARLMDKDVKLRWGGSPHPGAINGEAVLLSGLSQLNALKAGGIKVPEYTADYPLAMAWVQQGHMVFGRRSGHTQGKDIICMSTAKGLEKFGVRAPSLKNFRASEYWVKFVPSKSEWRFHILKNQSIGRALKVPAGIPATAAEPVPVRSRRRGYHFRHDVDPPKQLREAAKAACKALGYELGAVDVLETLEGHPCVLEVNSRPAIRDPYTLEKYENALRK